MSRASSWIGAALLASALGCAAHTRPVLGVPARAIAERIGRASASSDDDALVLTIERAKAGGKPLLVAHDVVRNAQRFQVEVDEAAEASVLGDVIWVQSGTSMRALDGRAGHELYRIALADGRYVGAARAGQRIAYGIVTGRALDPSARCQLVIVDARTGVRERELELPGDAGQPVAADGLVFVPSQRQRIIAIDVARGEEVARLRAESDAIEWLEVQRGAGNASVLVFGGRGFHRLTASDAQPSASYHLPEALSALPGRPSAPHSAYEGHTGRRIGLHVAPVASGASDVALLADRAYFAFYSQLFAFDARGALVYARSLPADVIGARVLPEGLLVATANGELLLLSHQSGQTLASQTLASSAGAAGVRSAELPSRAPQPLQADTSVKPSPEALTRALLELAGAIDSRLLPARSYAVQQLATMPDALITGGLLALYERPNTPTELQSTLAAALSERRTGLAALVSALDRRYDFLAETFPAPLAIIAPALARGGERAAVPGLLARLWDHETPVTALPSLAHAIGVLGDAQSASSLLEWLELYQADSSLNEEPAALVAVAKAALALDPERATTALAQIVHDGRMASAPAQHVAALLAPVAVEAAAPPVQVAAAAPVVKLPRLPSQQGLDAAFASRLEALKPCVVEELKQNPKLLQLRIAFIAEGDGSAHAFHFAPASTALTDCLYPKLAGIRVPAFSEPRSVAQVTINTHRASEATAAKQAAPGEETWWAWRTSAVRAKTNATPWWRVQQVVPPRLDESAGSALEIEAGGRNMSAATPAPAPSAPAPAPAPTTPAPASTTPAPAPAPATPAPAPPEAQDSWWVPQQ